MSPQVRVSALCVRVHACAGMRPISRQAPVYGSCVGPRPTAVVGYARAAAAGSAGRSLPSQAVQLLLRSHQAACKFCSLLPPPPPCSRGRRCSWAGNARQLMQKLLLVDWSSSCNVAYCYPLAHPPRLRPPPCRRFEGLQLLGTNTTWYFMQKLLPLQYNCVYANAAYRYPPAPLPRPPPSRRWRRCSCWAGWRRAACAPATLQAWAATTTAAATIRMC